MTTKQDELNKIGSCAIDSIRCMVAALNVDYDRLEELRDEADGYYEKDGERGGRAHWAEDNKDDAAELAELEANAGECKSREDAEQVIHDDALSVEFRSGWSTDQSELKAEEFNILLTTGGPAVRIMGELDDGEPTRAWLEVQDWGTPWETYYEQGIGELLLEYCRCFYFGE